MMKGIAPVLLLAMVSGVSAQNAQKPKADLIFVHGNVYTGVVDARSGQARRGAGGS
jgi:hypothetical protein